MSCFHPFLPIPLFHTTAPVARSLAILGVLIVATPLQAAPITLEQAVQHALEKQPELRASASRVEAARGQAQQAGRWSNPELGLSLEDWELREPRWKNAKRLAGITQTVPFPGKKSLEREIGATGVHLSQAELALRRAETIRATKAAFYHALAAENLLQEGRILVQNAEALATAARRRVEAGAAPEQDTFRAEIPLENARISLADYQRDSVNARRTLATLLGCGEENLGSLQGKLAESASPALLAAAPALEEAPGWKAAREGVRRAQLEVRRANLEAYPDVTVGVSAGKEAVTNETIGQVSFGIPLPLFDDASGKRREARANLAAAQAEAEAARLRLAREWAESVTRVRTASMQAAAFRERILPKADEALRRMRAGFDEGKQPLNDLLDTQQTASEAHITYQQKLLELNLAQAELEARLATLNSSQKTDK